MKFSEIIAQASELLQRTGRLTYRSLKREFTLDDEALDDLKFELIEGQEVATDKDGKMLVWTGAETPKETASLTADALAAAEPPSPAPPALSEPEAPSGERRQLTVEFIDLVGSTALSGQLDPEEFRELVRAYQETCATVISQYDGHIAQYLGDGLLVYFGYPTAHEDDAARAIRAGLGIVEALANRSSTLMPSLHVRIGIHTGPVVVGEMGGGDRHEQLAIGETPNVAARVQGQAEPNTVVVSAATARLVSGLFEYQALGRQELRGVSTPLELYRVQGESVAQSRFEVAVRSGLTPLVGRESELGVLHERWTQAQAGAGQVVLLSGEPGIGKSRLVQELKDRSTQAGATQIEFRCSPYHLNNALYPIIEHLQRLLQFAPVDTPQTKFDKLKQTLGRYRFSQPDTVPLLAALLSLPHPEGVPPLIVSPQKQKEQTQAALVAWLMEETEQQPVYTSWEDLHWADPSTLEVVDLLLHQVPTVRLFVVLTFRPEFVPPWGAHSYLSQVTLSRLGHPQVSAMVERVTGGKALPVEVVQQIVTKTDGVPLFVEELTKMVLESSLVREENGQYVLTGPLPPLAIPSTLQDSLMARLDRLAMVREVAQLGATIGREFSYELLQAVSPLGKERLQQGLQQLVDAELVYQRGLPPQALYTFKHALIQDTAYASLLKSRRQQYHQQIAQVLEERFSDTTETPPELVAHHYTEAGLVAQALPYWQQAGQRAVERSANTEAIAHLLSALELLKTLPDSPEHRQREFDLHVALYAPFVITKGFASPEVESVSRRALELEPHIEDASQLGPVLWGMGCLHLVCGEHHKTRELMEKSLALAERQQDAGLLISGHTLLGASYLWSGVSVAARTHLEQGVALADSSVHSSYTLSYSMDLSVFSRTDAALALWCCGYPDQARKRSHEALHQIQDLSHPPSVVLGLVWTAIFQHVHQKDACSVSKHTAAAIPLETEHGLPDYLAVATMLHGWALAEQGQAEAGIVQIRQGLAAPGRTMGGVYLRPYSLGLLAEAQSKIGQLEEGLQALTEALRVTEKNEERWYEAELHRLKGELLLNYERRMMNDERQTQEVEACFHKAIEVARRQQAKSLELRASTSLARLWQQQGKQTEARDLLTPVYDWFTEGFDTTDLKDAKALLAELGKGH